MHIISVSTSSTHLGTACSAARTPLDASSVPARLGGAQKPKQKLRRAPRRPGFVVYSAVYNIYATFMRQRNRVNSSCTYRQPQQLYSLEPRAVASRLTGLLPFRCSTSAASIRGVPHITPTTMAGDTQTKRRRHAAALARWPRTGRASTYELRSPTHEAIAGQAH